MLWVPLRLGSDNRNQISMKSAEITENLKFWNFALRDPRTWEMEESASHHLFIICFALLRAEMCENDAGEGRRWPQIIRNLIFRTPWKPTFYNCSHTSRHHLSAFRLYTFTSNYDLSGQNPSWIDLYQDWHQFDTWSVNITRNVKTSVFALRDPRTSEKEESASHHVFIICFCAAARRNGWKRLPGR